MADVSTQNALGGANGSAIATPSEGLAPYSYLWSTGADTESISGLAAGTYELTVTDSNLCEDNKIFTIIDPAIINSFEDYLITFFIFQRYHF